MVTCYVFQICEKPQTTEGNGLDELSLRMNQLTINMSYTYNSGGCLSK